MSETSFRLNQTELSASLLFQMRTVMDPFPETKCSFPN